MSWGEHWQLFAQLRDLNLGALEVAAGAAGDGQRDAAAKEGAAGAGGTEVGAPVE